MSFLFYKFFFYWYFRTVLELGSGMGVTGITVCRCCSPSSLVFSDYNPSVLQKLRTNVGVNGLSNATPVVSVEQLDWTSATEEHLQKIGADVVIAAGQIYVSGPHGVGIYQCFTWNIGYKKNLAGLLTPSEEEGSIRV